MAKSRKKRKTSRRRWLSFFLFLLTAAVVFTGRQDLLWGLQGYLLDRIDFVRVESPSDLPSGSGGPSRPALVVGIPDYKNQVRFPYERKILTCYRVVGFENRLCVCTEEELKAPEAIGEVIQSRTVRGRLEGLAGSPLEDRLRRLFWRASSIRLEENAFLLTEDPSPLPSLFKLGLLCLCLILCCFFAFRVIQ
jgi:hypothetical protein